MRLNTLRSTPGAKHSKKRVGRGPGSGLGKTCGRGQKGQKARSGGYHKVGFEGGQMPIQRRLPKVGFTSRKSLSRAEVRLSEVAALDGGEITMEILRAANIITANIKNVKIMKNSNIENAIIVKGISVTKGAREAILAAGGKVED